ncbi:MAG: amidohydrolase, partial [Succinivibrio sp.]
DKCVAIRCDIDALPVQEETGLPYQSKVKGVMHACGHDFHTALILGSAMLLKERESELQGRVRCVFQPAEEAPGGAQKIIDSGALEGVSAIFGVHTIPMYEPGTLGIREGATHAAVDRFKLVFTGKGTHAAHPNLGIDTLQVAAHFAVAAQSIVSRNSDPFATNLVSITRLEAGNTWNVIPETAILEGTVRTMTKENRDMVKRRLVELADGIAKSFGARADFTWVMGLPPMQNDKKLSDFASDLARSDGFTVERTPGSLGGEDFALYEEKIPGAFVQVGTGPSLPNHNPRFVADKKALFPASKFMAHLASEYLRRF